MPYIAAPFRKQLIPNFFKPPNFATINQNFLIYRCLTVQQTLLHPRCENNSSRITVLEKLFPNSVPQNPPPSPPPSCVPLRIDCADGANVAPRVLLWASADERVASPSVRDIQPLQRPPPSVVRAENPLKLNPHVVGNVPVKILAIFSPVMKRWGGCWLW